MYGISLLYRNQLLPTLLEEPPGPPSMPINFVFFFLPRFCWSFVDIFSRKKERKEAALEIDPFTNNWQRYREMALQKACQKVLINCTVTCKLFCLIYKKFLDKLITYSLYPLTKVVFLGALQIARRTRSRRVWIYFYKDKLKANLLSTFVLDILHLSEGVHVWLNYIIIFRDALANSWVVRQEFTICFVNR